MGVPYAAWSGFAWFVAALMGGAFDGLVLNSESHTSFNKLIQLFTANSSQHFGVVVTSISFWNDILNLATFNMSIFDPSVFVAGMFFRWVLVIIFALPIAIVVGPMMAGATMNALGFGLRAFTGQFNR